MRLSLRGWLLLVSIAFAAIVVGGVALTTYVIVTDGMQEVAYDAADRSATVSAELVRRTVSEAELAAASRGLLGEDRDRAAAEALVRELENTLLGAGLGTSSIALYDGDLEIIWWTGVRVDTTAALSARTEALRTQRPVRTQGRPGGVAQGLFSEAELAPTTVHVPMPLPGGRLGVLDVVYDPAAEETVIDAIRTPMAILALSAMLVMVALMQSSMVWVLGLVRELRRATDSIDAGRLDERLPMEGDNEIGELARSLNRLIERLHRRSVAQTRFVADASHELATPVAGIRGYTSILRAWGGEDPTVREEAIDAIDRESKRMARLTSDLLNLLHADEGVRLKSERFDLNALARERLATVATKYLDKEIDFEGPEGESLLMTGDPDRVEDIVSILLDNAAKYTPVNGRVALRTSGRREDVTIEISDTGKGIPTDELPHIFDRFFRSEQARAGGEAGFGLGLSIADSIVRSMNGTIGARSIEGEGTTFTIVLPRGRI